MMQLRRMLLANSIAPPSGYRFIEYAISGGGGSCSIELPIGFYKTDEIETEAAIDIIAIDKFLVASTIWNNDNNRFAIVGSYGNGVAIPVLIAPSSILLIFSEVVFSYADEWG